MTEKWLKYLSKWGIGGTILTDHPKAFECILRDILIVKLDAYGFEYQSLIMIERFLSNRQQKTMGGGGERSGGVVVWFSVYGMLLNDWANVVCVDVLVC